MEIEESDIKSSIAEWQREQEAQRGSAQVAHGVSTATVEAERVTCSCCENNDEKQTEGCGCCGWKRLPDGRRYHAESGRTVAAVAAARIAASDEAVGAAAEGTVEDGAADEEGTGGGSVTDREAPEGQILDERRGASAAEEAQSVTIKVKNLYGKEWILCDLIRTSTIFDLKESVFRVSGIRIGRSAEEEVRLLFEGKQLLNDDEMLESHGIGVGVEANEKKPPSPLFLVRRKNTDR